MKKNNILKIAIGLSISAAVTALYGEDLNATSTQPKVTFIDSNHAEGDNTAVWEIKQTEASGFDYFYLRNILDDAKIITIDRLQDGSSTQGGSIQVISSGDLSLAGGAVYIGRDSKTLNVGKTADGDATLNVYGDASIGADIALDNGTSRWRVSNIDDWFTLGPSLKNRWVFTISPNTPLYAFNIADNGLVGIGTSAPAARLDVAGDTIVNGELNTTKAITTSLTEDSTANTQTLLTLSRDNTDTDYASDVSFVFENIQDSFKWTFRTLESEQGFSISKVNSGAKEMIITGNDHPDGIQILMGDGGKYSGGQWLVASSRAYKENIKEIDTQKALKAFHQLKPVSFNYKVQKDEPVVGFIAEDVPDMVASRKRDSLSAMEMVALLTKVVQVQEKKIDEKENEIINLQKRLGKIESLLSNITLNISEETPKISLKK